MSKSLLSGNFATTLSCWRHSGFPIDAQVRIGAQDRAARIGLDQYTARAPLSLAKISYLPAEVAVRYCSAFHPALGDSSKVWTARDFIALATLFIPPQGVRLIRFLGLYSSRALLSFLPCVLLPFGMGEVDCEVVRN
jgi:hypothetical protein